MLKNLIFTEKYRPDSWEHLIINEQDKYLLVNLIKKPKEIPNLFLFSFLPGTGKTSTAYMIANLLQADKLILNASDERGIDTIREKVSSFTKSMSLNPEIKKCVILDEADYLTPQAQASLRNLMEETCANAFFILTANHENKVIEPIKSRCALINFNCPPKEQILKYLQYIVEEEKLIFDELQLKELMESFYSDIRRMVLTLQMIKEGYPISKVLEFEKKFKTFLTLIKEKKLEQAKEKILSEEINVKEFIDWAFIHATNNTMPIDKLGKFCKILANIELYSLQGVNPKAIFLAYIGDICSLLIG
jgi:DNA polymerase III delta prime subunit